MNRFTACRNGTSAELWRLGCYFEEEDDLPHGGSSGLENHHEIYYDSDEGGGARHTHHQRHRYSSDDSEEEESDEDSSMMWDEDSGSISDTSEDEDESVDGWDSCDMYDGSSDASDGDDDSSSSSSSRSSISSHDIVPSLVDISSEDGLSDTGKISELRVDKGLTLKNETNTSEDMKRIRDNISNGEGAICMMVEAIGLKSSLSTEYGLKYYDGKSFLISRFGLCKVIIALFEQFKFDEVSNSEYAIRADQGFEEEQDLICVIGMLHTAALMHKYVGVCLGVVLFVINLLTCCH